MSLHVRARYRWELGSVSGREDVEETQRGRKGKKGRLGVSIEKRLERLKGWRASHSGSFGVWRTLVSTETFFA